MDTNSLIKQPVARGNLQYISANRLITNILNKNNRTLFLNRTKQKVAPQLKLSMVYPLPIHFTKGPLFLKLTKWGPPLLLAVIPSTI